MKLIVFGATGKTGTIFMEKALKNGHEVTAFVRNAQKLTMKHEHLHVVEGSVLDVNAVAVAMEGHDAVVSCLGGEGNQKSTILTDMTETIVKGMKKSGIDRIAYIATAGIFDEIPGKFTNFILSLFLKNVIADHKGAVKHIMRNNLRHTIARPVSLTNGPLKETYRKVPVGVPKGGWSISREDVAHFLLDSIENDNYINEEIGLAY